MSMGPSPSDSADLAVCHLHAEDVLVFWKRDLGWTGHYELLVRKPSKLERLLHSMGLQC